MVSHLRHTAEDKRQEATTLGKKECYVCSTVSFCMFACVGECKMTLDQLENNKKEAHLLRISEQQGTEPAWVQGPQFQGWLLWHVRAPSASLAVRPGGDAVLPWTLCAATSSN